MSPLKTYRIQSIYHPSKETQWADINWSKTQKTIVNLQNRITKATEQKNYRKVRDLQRLLKRSLSARLKAIQLLTLSFKETSDQEIFEKKFKKKNEIWSLNQPKIQLASPASLASLALASRAKVTSKTKVELQKKIDPLAVSHLSNCANQLVWSMAIYPCTKQNSGFQVDKNQKKVFPFPLLLQGGQKWKTKGINSHFAKIDSPILPNINENFLNSDSFRILKKKIKNPQKTINFEIKNKTLRSLVNQNSSDDWNIQSQIHQLFNKPNAFPWVLEAVIDIDFTKINQNWLTKHSPMEKKALQNWLNAYVLEDTSFLINKKKKKVIINQHITYSNQLIIFNLKNIVFNYLISHLKKKYNSTLQIFHSSNNFIINGETPFLLERVKKTITEFLNELNLQIPNDKIILSSVYDGFHFLNWHFKKYRNGLLLCKISKKNISQHRKEIKYLTKTIHSPEVLITRLNQKIESWMIYHQYCNGIHKVWGLMNIYLYRCLMKWGRKRHGQKTQKWIFQKYWIRLKGRWTFYAIINEKTFILKHYDCCQKRGARVLK